MSPLSSSSTSNQANPANQTLDSELKAVISSHYKEVHAERAEERQKEILRKTMKKAEDAILEKERYKLELALQAALYRK